MFNLIRKKSRKRNAREKGQALILVLVILTIAALLIPALLGFIGTGAKSGTVYDTKTSELYAADAGIQDATWQIKSDNIDDLLDVSNTINYNRYDFTNIWADTGVPSINNQSVNVTIQNEWIPSNFNPANEGLDAADLKQIVDNAKLVVTGSTIGTNITATDGTTKISQYKITITYFPEEDETMTVDSIGVWLPPGCTYFYDSGHKSNFEDPTYPSNCQSIPNDPIFWQGSYAIVWDFNSPAFTDFPSSCVSGTMPLVMEATFYFQPPANQLILKPPAVSWIVPGGIADVPVSWDTDNRIFKLESVAGQTTVDSYICKSEARSLSAAIGGDYYATGNSNLSAPSGSYYRTIWHDPSTATVSSANIPANARVTAAFLYWSGWKSDNSINVSPFPDSCSNINTNWTAGAGNVWSSTGSWFQGHYDINHINRNLELTNGLNLSADNQGLVALSWDQWYTSGTGSNSPTSAPASDAINRTGTWTSTGTDYFSQVSDTLDTTYITQTASGVGYTYFGYTPSFIIPSTATGISVQVGYRASVPAPIILRAAGGNATGTTSVTCSQPSGTATNDVLVAFIIDYSTTNAQSAAPTGWQGRGYTYNASGRRFQVFTAVVGKNGLTGTSWSFSGLTTRSQGVIIGYYNADTTGYGGLDTAVSVRDNASGTYGTSSITTVSNGAMVIAAFGSYVAASTYTWSSESCATIGALTERFDNKNSTYCSIAVADKLMTTAGATGASTATPTSGQNNAGILLALKPAVVVSYPVSYPANVHSGLKINGTLYNATDPGSVPANSFTDYSYTYNTNPAGGAWTPAAVNSSLQAIGVNATQGVSISKVYITVTYTAPLGVNDGLDFELGVDDGHGGTSWSAPIKDFRYGDSGISTSQPSSNNFTYPIDANYLDNGFKIRFSLVGFNGTGQYVNIDDITLTARVADSSVVFKIDDGINPVNQVYLDAGADGKVGTPDDQPHTGPVELTASRSQVSQNLAGGTPHGYSYSSYRDVTKLVQNYSQQPTAPDTNVQGYATYSVGSIYSDTPSYEEWSYACWSIVIVYESEDTLGHQLYLYDTFTNSNQDTTNGVDVDFDHDGQPGGTISDYIVPPQITGAVTNITVNNGGSGYTSTPSVAIIGNGTEARAVAIVSAAKVVTGISIKNGGHNYTSPPIIKITGGGGTGAAATASIGDEVNVGKITTFVGEGDVWYGGDYLALNAPEQYRHSPWNIPNAYRLWDGVTCNDNSKTNPDNIFNSTSIGLTTNDGIDVDTLGLDPPNGQYITWASGLLNTGETSAHIDMVTHTDSWNLVYMIISFRSATTTGGSLSYLIH